MNPKLIITLVGGVLTCINAFGCVRPVSACDHDPGNGFGLVRLGRPVAVFVDTGADAAVKHAGLGLVADLERVAGNPAALFSDLADAKSEIVVVGVLGQSPLIDRLVTGGKIRVNDLVGQWEAYRQVVVAQPVPGVDRALVIVGSDRRGAVFGAYDLSAKIGVNPWYWWADVPVARKANIFISSGEHKDQPKVKYRGIFINDEDPSFTTWARTKFGGVNSHMYGKVFELMLRLKANYLWPAMWQPKAFNEDDPQNMVLADEMGVIMGTSHHEPMMRAHDEWGRFKGGKWDYVTNGAKLRDFWRGGIQRMVSKQNGKPFESLVTIGMRGDGDEPMSKGTATRLLEGIVRDQRQILTEVTGRPAAQTPQMWALYKEVQAYYDSGMKVPDDVLLLFSDDNWGQVRRLPERGVARPGGHGVYYHFDYVGGPRNYKWLNTNQIEKVWQQMNLAHEYGADALWVVNVGDIKPMEFPISFFLDMAWNPQAMTLEAMSGYGAHWAEATFGPAVANDVAEVVAAYGRLAARRKPEFLNPDSFPLGASTPQALDGGGFGARVAEVAVLEDKVAVIKQSLRPEQLAAYFQLVEHPVLALANIYKLYYYTAWNRKLAAANDARANVFADLAEAAFKQDQQITGQYHALNGGKWDGMMLQTHIGYTSWQQPAQQTMPEIQRISGGAQTNAAIVMQPLQRGPFGVSEQGAFNISIEAAHFSRSSASQGLAWTLIPNLGWSSLGSVTALPQGRASTTVADNIRLDYDFETQWRGEVRLKVHLVPTLDTRNAGGVKLAVALDNGPAQVLNMNLVPTGEELRSPQEKAWGRAVEDNAAVLFAQFKEMAPGKHVIHLWRLDDNVVVQKLEVVRVGSE